MNDNDILTDDNDTDTSKKRSMKASFWILVKLKQI